jgi:hypothetical protein
VILPPTHLFFSRLRRESGGDRWVQGGREEALMLLQSEALRLRGLSVHREDSFLFRMISDLTAQLKLADSMVLTG